MNRTSGDSYITQFPSPPHRPARRRISRAALLLATAMTCATAGIESARAQTADAQGNGQGTEAASQATDEIVVTARRRGEREIDVPESITALGGADLKKAGISSLDDLGHAVPNVLFNRRGDNEPNVVIRGIGSFGNVQGVNFYFDDVPNFTDQASRLVDLERVEVLKGPQGTLYGGAALGGAVKYITRQPSDQFEGSFGADVGSLGTANVQGSLNVPLTGSLFFRTSVYSDNNDGWSRNPVTGNNNDRYHEYGVRAALRFAPTDRTDITLSARYSYLNNGGNDYVLEDNETDYRYVNPLNTDVFAKRAVFGAALHIQQAIGDWKLVSVSSYTERRQKFRLDLDYSSADGIYTPSNPSPQKTPVWTQELRFESPADKPLSAVIGFYAASVRNRETLLHGDIILGSAVTGGAPVTIADFHNSSTREVNLAAFGTATYRVGRFELSAGARLNYDRYSATNYNGPVSDAIRDTTVLPKVTLAYKPDANLNLYASYAKGYEPGRLNLFSDTLVPYRAETTDNFEVGVKGRTPGGVLSYELAGYYLLNRRRQFETQVVDSSGVPQGDLTTNIGDARTYGLEGALTARAAPGLTFTASGGYLHSRFDTAVFDQVVYHHVRVPYAPKFSGTFAADYSVPVSDDLTASFRADMTYTDTAYWDVANQYAQRAYTLFGLRFAVASESQHWEFSVRGSNLFNKRYNTEFISNFTEDPGFDATARNPTCNQCNLARVGQPRLIVGSISYHF